MNLHWDGYGKDHKSAGNSTTIPALTEGFHDYGLGGRRRNTSSTSMARKSAQISRWSVAVPGHLKLTEEIGKWGGDITKAELPDFFEVEYVRVVT